MTQAVDIFNDFAVNETDAQDGVWVPYRGDVSFLIAKSGNKSFRKQAQVVFKKHGRLLEQGGEVAEAKSRELMIDLMAKTILKGWKVGEDTSATIKVNGEDLAYSYDSAKKMLAIDGFREWVDTQAKDEAQYKAVKDEEDEKN